MRRTSPPRTSPTSPSHWVPTNGSSVASPSPCSPTSTGARTCSHGRRRTRTWAPPSRWSPTRDGGGAAAARVRARRWQPLSPGRTMRVRPSLASTIDILVPSTGPRLESNLAAGDLTVDGVPRADARPEDGPSLADVDVTLSPAKASLRRASAARARRTGSQGGSARGPRCHARRRTTSGASPPRPAPRASPRRTGRGVPLPQTPRVDSPTSSRRHAVLVRTPCGGPPLRSPPPDAPRPCSWSNDSFLRRHGVDHAPSLRACAT